MNVMFALRTTATTSLSTVTSAAQTVNEGLNVISDLAQVASAHSSAYKADTIHSLNEDAIRRRTRRKMTLAMEDASFYVEMDNQLSNDPKLKEFYEATLAEYSKPTAIAAE